MSFWVLNPICCLNAGFTTGIERNKMEMIFLKGHKLLDKPRNQESLCWLYKGAKEQFEASLLWGWKSWNDFWNHCWAADYRSHTKHDNSKRLGHWNHSYHMDEVSIQQKKASHFWGEGEEKEWKDVHSQPFVLDTLKNKEKREMVERKYNLHTGTKCSISTDWFI